MTTRLRAVRALSALVVLVLAGGCSVIEIASRPAPTLYQLSPKSTYDPELPDIRGTLAVEVPSAISGLNTSRIALRPDATSLQFYAGALWIDVLPVMVQQLMIESIDNSGKADALGSDVPGFRAEFALISHIREFQAEYRGEPDQPPEIRVRLQLRLVRLPRRDLVDSRSEEATIRAASTSLPDIIAAFDEAFGKVAKRVVSWALIEAKRAEQGRV